MDHSEKVGVGSDARLGLGFADQLPRQVEWHIKYYTTNKSDLVNLYRGDGNLNSGEGGVGLPILAARIL